MRTNSTLTIIAMSMVAGIGLHTSWAQDRIGAGSNNGAPPGKIIGDRTASTTQPSDGRSLSDANAAAVRNVLSHVTDLALTPEGIGQLSTYVRIDSQMAEGAASPNLGTAHTATDQMASIATDNLALPKSDDIDKAIQQFQQDWRDKYKTDFKLSDDNQTVVFNDTFQIFRGDIGDNARTASERTTPDILPESVAAGRAATGQNRAKKEAANEAIVYVSGSHSQPSYSLRLANDHGGAAAWKIIAPMGTTQQLIHDDLLKHLQALHDQRANWPADQNAGYRTVSREILSTFADSKGSSTTQPSGPTPANINGKT